MMTQLSTASSAVVPGGEPLQVAPKRHVGRYFAVAALLLLVVTVVNSMVENPRYGWEYVAQYLFADSIIRGVWLTILLTIVAMLFGLALGLVVALARLSPNPILSWSASVFSWFFRAVPPLVQLLFWSFFAALYPVITIGIPFGGPDFVSFSGNLPLFLAAVLGLGLMESAYMAEIVRSGLISVDEGQIEAGKALGLKKGQILRRITLPQAMRVIIPPTGNEVISMLKTTSLVSVIAYQDLLYSAQLIYARNFQQIPLLIIVTIWYLVLAGALSIVQQRIEKHYGRAHVRQRPHRQRVTSEGKPA